MKYAMRLWWLWPVLMLGAASFVSYRLLRTPVVTKQAYVNCATAQPENFKCWQARYQAMVSQESPKTAFADVQQAYAAIPYVQSNCHQIAHVIGRAGGKKYGDVAKAYDQGDNFCWSGYYHGVMEAVADNLGPDNLLGKLNDICVSARAQRYSFHHYNCVHGLGHGLMAVYNNQLFDVLKDCNLLTDDWEQQSCYGGAFMENVMSEVNPDHHTDYLKADQPLYPCTAVDQPFKQQCYLMQTSHALVTVKEDFSAVFELCAGVEAPFTDTCYQSLGRDASGRSVSNLEQTQAKCLLGPSREATTNCFIGAVKDFISYFHSDQQGKDLCNSIEDQNIKTTCLQTAEAYYATF
jgi:hypothetical protein